VCCLVAKKVFMITIKVELNRYILQDRHIKLDYHLDLGFKNVFRIIYIINFFMKTRKKIVFAVIIMMFFASTVEAADQTVSIAGLTLLVFLFISFFWLTRKLKNKKTNRNKKT